MKTPFVSAPLILIILPALACTILTGSGGAITPAPTAVSPPTAAPLATATLVAVSGATYYVGRDACDEDGSGDGQSPFCSFDTALARLQPGDALVIKAGVYTERLVITGLSGSAESPILIRGEARDSVIFDGGCPEFPCPLDSVSWPGDEETGMISVQDSQWVIVSDLTAQNVIGVGVNVTGGNGITVSGVAVNGAGNAGLLFKYLSDLTVTGNDVGFVQLGYVDDSGRPHPGAHEALSVVGVNGFVVADNYVHDTLKEGIDIKESSTNGEVRDNFVERACSVGIYINEAFDLKVYRNRIRRAGYFLSGGSETLCREHPVFGPLLGQFYGYGIQLAVGDLGELSRGKLSNIELYQNVVWDAHGNGLEFWDELRESGSGQGEMTDIRIYNNVIYNTGGAGIRLQDVSRVEVVNNILALNGESAFTGNAVSTNTLSHNLFLFQREGEQPFGAEAVVGDPLFVDPPNGDFHLQPGSPAIDAGMDLGLPFAGGAPDIGAFEYGLAESGGGALADVRYWLYLIDVNLAPETVTLIENSAYDLVVLDFISSEASNTDYPMAEVIARLHNAPHPKSVVAYIDIGQAESYRTYWQPGWGIGNPDWIAGADPDGWEGNFPVAYWRDEWRAIWLGSNGYLQAIVDAGFDGVYLDWVEAYSDENVLAIAKQDGVDAQREMIRWVGDLAAFGRARRPGFVVIAQNAAELATFDDYVATIDAIAQEQVWFDGAADNDPPGDCPLPRAEAEVDTPAYYESLSPPCRTQYDQYPDSTLHVSSEAYLRDLQLAQSKGLIILTVDYALDPENVAWVYRTSRELGFVPFAGSRALDQYVEVVGH